MIQHFILRDIKDFAFHWTILAICLIIAIITYFVTPKEIAGAIPFALAYGCFFFAFIPMGHIIGSAWRSQHMLSRSYLLSLPVPRITCFNINILRSFVFWIPFVLCAFLIPHFSYRSSYGKYYFNVFAGFYPLGVLLGIFAYQCTMFVTVIHHEEIMRLVSREERFFAWIKNMAWTFLGVGMYFCVIRIAKTDSNAHAMLYLGIETFVAFLSYFVARKKWIGE